MISGRETVMMVGKPAETSLVNNFSSPRQKRSQIGSKPTNELTNKQLGVGYLESTRISPLSARNVIVAI